MARKPYSLSGAATPTMVDRIDKMLKELYRDSNSSHNLLSSQHADTTPATAVRASIAIVNAAGLWTQVTPETGGTFPRYYGADTTFAAVTEPDITDGTLLARVASAETITGRWFFSGAGRVVMANAVPLQWRNGGNTADVNGLNLSSDILTLGFGNDADVETIRINPRTTIHFMTGAATTRANITASAFTTTIPMRAANGSASAPAYAWTSFTSSGLYALTGPIVAMSVSNGDAMRWDANLATFTGGAFHLGATLTPATLGAGNNNNYNPTSFALNYGFRITGNATPSTITSITAPTNGAVAGDGRVITFWNIGSPDVLFLHDDGVTGTAANRILTGSSLTRRVKTNGYISFWYDTTSNRWRELAYSQGGLIDLTSDVTGILPVANGGTGTSTAFTAGSVVFAGASGVYTQDNANIFFDNTNKRLGIGTAAPSRMVEVNKSSNSNSSAIYPAFRVVNSLVTQGDGATTFNQADAQILSGNGTVDGRLIAQYETGFSGVKFGSISNHALALYTNGQSNVRMTVTAAGLVGIGVTAPDFLLEARGGIIASGNAGGGLKLYGATLTTGLTGIAETNVAYYARLADQGDGGVIVDAMSATTGGTALLMRAITGAEDPSDGTATMAFRAGRRSGTGGVNLADAETALQIQKFDGTALVTVFGSGVLAVSANATGQVRIDDTGGRNAYFGITGVAANYGVGLWFGGTQQFHMRDRGLALGSYINQDPPADSLIVSGDVGIGVTAPATKLSVAGVITAASTTATPAGGSTAARLLFGTTAGFGVYYGSGAPTVSAAQGSLYLRSDGSSTSTRLYVNTDGATTWTNVTTAT